MGKKHILISWLALLITSAIHAAPLDNWLDRQKSIAEEKILANISPADGRPGAVLASPSRQDPDYYYHWVRDAALVMDVWMRQLEGRVSSSLSRHDIDAM